MNRLAQLILFFLIFPFCIHAQEERKDSIVQDFKDNLTSVVR